jgi:hypothetical protein
VAQQIYSAAKEILMKLISKLWPIFLTFAFAKSNIIIADNGIVAGVSVFLSLAGCLLRSSQSASKEITQNQDKYSEQENY